jgi:DNA-binding CsgD family transcriptional regulator
MEANERLDKMDEGIRRAFTKVKEELDQHLDTINQGTQEIDYLHDLLTELEKKIDKLTERIDGISLQLNPHFSNMSITLTHREQEVFVVIYASDDKLTASDVARKLGLTEDMVNNAIYNITAKGVPLLKQLIDDKIYLYLDAQFKSLQTKNRMIKIEEGISKHIREERSI